MRNKRIALITKFGWVGISTSVINSAIFWESKGYSVDIYCEKPDNRFRLPCFNTKNIKFIVSQINHGFIVDDIIFYFKFFFFKEKFSLIICFDFPAIIRGGLAGLLTNTPYIYHSLEFFEINSKSTKNKIKKYLEKKFARFSLSIFTQSEARLKYLSTNLSISKNKIKISYNSPIGDPLHIKSNYFQKKFMIAQNRKIVLCIGSLIKEHFIIELIKSISDWPEEFVLILHGWFSNSEDENYILCKQKECINKLFISRELFDEDNKYIPYLSCDIGFVGFRPENNNLKYAAGAAGKLFDFMRAGKPIIAYDSLDMFNIVHEKVGLIFKDIKEIPNVLKKIKENYKKYSTSCYEIYEQYEFFQQYEKVYKTLIARLNYKSQVFGKPEKENCFESSVNCSLPD